MGLPLLRPPRDRRGFGNSGRPSGRATRSRESLGADQGDKGFGAMNVASGAAESTPVERLQALRLLVARRARDCGRDPASVKLAAVSKTIGAEGIWPTIA